MPGDMPGDALLSLGSLKGVLIALVVALNAALGIVLQRLLKDGGGRAEAEKEDGSASTGPPPRVLFVTGQRRARARLGTGEGRGSGRKRQRLRRQPTAGRRCHTQQRRRCARQHSRAALTALHVAASGRRWPARS